MDLLPVNIVTDKPRSRWQLRDEQLVPCIHEVVPFINNPAAIEQADLIKHEKRRLVFRHRLDGINYLIKAFPLDTLDARLRHRKYADTEAENVLRAGQLGIPVPVLHGFGYRRQWFLTVWNALCYEFIDAPSMEIMLQAEQNQKKRLELLRRAFPLFRHLYKKACNHIDLKPGSFLLGAEGSDTIIDFQYAAFMPAPSAGVLASQAGHFAWDVSVRHQWLEPQAMQQWFHGLLEYLGIEGNDKLQSIFRNTAHRRYSIRQRLDGTAGQD